MSSFRFVRTSTLMGLTVPAMWAFISLLPDRSAVVFLAGSRTFELITVILWPGFLVAAMEAVFDGRHPAVVYVAMSLINVGCYFILGWLLVRTVATVRAITGKKREARLLVR
jgi:hypothetical protein